MNLYDSPIYNDGYSAGANGKSRDDNPYSENFSMQIGKLGMKVGKTAI
jgi:hypothetical protein